MRELNYYLWKLKFLKGFKTSNNGLNKKNIPDDVFQTLLTGDFIKIESVDINEEKLDRFLKVKNCYNLNIIKICTVICTIFFIILVLVVLFFR